MDAQSSPTVDPQHSPQPLAARSLVPSRPSAAAPAGLARPTLPPLGQSPSGRLEPTPPRPLVARHLPRCDCSHSSCLPALARAPPSLLSSLLTCERSGSVRPPRSRPFRAVSVTAPRVARALLRSRVARCPRISWDATLPSRRAAPPPFYPEVLAKRLSPRTRRAHPTAALATVRRPSMSTRPTPTPVSAVQAASRRSRPPRPHWPMAPLKTARCRASGRRQHSLRRTSPRRRPRMSPRTGWW
mmetsp:Transcript_86486/g.172616  ORF Transcript_86486/g.172616 Transcript_86486/m.172616 type:complete len:243 (+) Transcript_86486:290-1018(+)